MTRYFRNKHGALQRVFGCCKLNFNDCKKRKLCKKNIDFTQFCISSFGEFYFTDPTFPVRVNTPHCWLSPLMALRKALNNMTYINWR